jgi:hypothetical protein
MMVGRVFPVFKRVLNACGKPSKKAGHQAYGALASGCLDQGTTDMLRIFSLALLTIFAAPASAMETPTDGSIIAQEQRPPQQSPKRDCERKQDEGVS